MLAIARLRIRTIIAGEIRVQSPHWFVNYGTLIIGLAGELVSSIYDTLTSLKYFSDQSIGSTYESPRMSRELVFHKASMKNSTTTIKNLSL